jgi:hypothetical protein
MTWISYLYVGYLSVISESRTEALDSLLDWHTIGNTLGDTKAEHKEDNYR